MPDMPAYEDWKAPWEISGDDFNPERARRLIYDLKRDKDELNRKNTSLTTERDDAVKKAEEYTRKDETEVERLRREVAERDERLAKATPNDLEIARLRVALDKGLTAKQAKRLVGSTEEELSKDADDMLAELGVKQSEEGGGTEAGPSSRRQPEPLRTPSGGTSNGGPEMTVEEFAAQYGRQ